MDTVFTLQWAEFLVAEKLRNLLPKKDGYSVLLPASRQEKGFDLAVLHRAKSGKTRTKTIQVKASRTWLGSEPKNKKTVGYKYTSRFNHFDVPREADLIVLLAMYAPDIARTKRVSAQWYQDCSLVFTQKEMVEFMKSCKTRGGNVEHMFYFGFNDVSEIILTRGDRYRSGKNYASYVLKDRIVKLMND